MPDASNTLIAVDVGNSRIKLGRFVRSDRGPGLPEPAATSELPIDSNGEFDAQQLAAWCGEHVAEEADWLVSSVHRAASEKLAAAVANLAKQAGYTWPLRQIAFPDVPLVIEVDAPERVGMDRLMGAVAADRLRSRGRAAIVVDLGTATKASMLSGVGAFVGGAILPGLEMSARALEQQTDVLPRVDVEHWRRPPRPLGKATVPAIESGIFWGTVGAVRELIARLSESLAPLPVVFVTGGSSRLVFDVLATNSTLELHHVPHLVLGGVAIVDAAGKH